MESPADGQYWMPSDEAGPDAGVGMIMVRNVRPGGFVPEIPKDKKLVMIFGVMAVPMNCMFQGEHQYGIVCNNSEMGGFVRLTAAREGCVDRTDYAVGRDVSALLTSPIWRV